MHLESRKLGGRVRLVAAALASVLGVLGLAGTTHAAGQYATVEYPPSTAEIELQVGVTYTLWIPEGVKALRGVIVHQHGAGTTASKEGATAAYDLHWQALAKKWDCALLGPSYHVLNEKIDISPGASELWFDPRRGSEKTFLKALDDLAAKSEHPELKTVPWVLWGHSGGGIWSDVMTTLHPDRVVAVWMRSGTALMFLTHAEFTRPKVPDALAAIPMMCNPGVKEKPMGQEKPGAEDKRTVEEKMKGPWLGSLATFKEYRAKGVPIGLAPDPRTGHECGDSRYLAIPFLDACLALRLPDKGAKDQTLKPIDPSKTWLALVLGEKAEPAASYQGNPKEAVWLPNEAVAKAWMEYIKTGAVGDTTPPPAPTNVRVSSKGDKGVEITWDAEADFESGIRGFIIQRDGQELAQVPPKPVGKFGRPLFQSMTYHETPSKPLPEMRYVDASAKPDDKHTYAVITVNSVELKSEPSAKATPQKELPAQTPPREATKDLIPFDGEKSSWHGFDRYDFLMDEQTLEIKPAVKGKGAAKGQRQCIVVVPKKVAAGNPWSWQGCYWDHEPQTEVELLKRGFHIGFAAPDPNAQGKVWDAWYKFLTEKHGLAKKAAFVGMSKGGVNEFNWGVVNPDKVACIYADNTALYDEDFAKVPELAKHDVPLLHVCGSEDFLVQRHTRVVEDTYHQLGGLITVIIKEGHAHHPHSLQNAKPIADWIEQHMTPSTANRPAFVDKTYTKGYYYSLEPSYIYLKEEDTYATARGPGFTECYDRYDGLASGKFKMGGISIIVPKTVAQGKPWVFTGDPIERDATVEQALLAKGYHILIVSPLGSGMTQKQWDDAYKLLVDDGFSKKPVLKGTGAKAGEAYAWAVANPNKVSCIYARNPLMKSLMAGKRQPIDNLAALAKAGVPVLHDCGASDPWLDKQTRVVEKRYKELEGKIPVIVREGEGHFPLSPKDPKSVVDFIIKNAREGAAQPKSTAIPVKGDAPISLYGGGAALRDDCVKKQAGDSFRWTGSGQITWKVQVDQAGDYEVALNHAAEPGAVGQHVQISSGSSRVEYTMAKTKGVFGDRSYEMTPIKDRLRLEAGAQSITLSIQDAPEAMVVLQFRSLELIPVAAKPAIEADRQEAKRARAGTEWMAKAGYGLMFHWTSQSVGKDGTHKSYARAVEAFDVKRFVEMVEATGAGYIILTIGHAESYCPAPLKAWEKYHPGKTTQRDLIAEMADALNAKGIKLMCYLNAASLAKYPKAGEEEFSRIMTEVVTEFGQRYKEKVSGYWIDCCYQAKEKYPGFSFREFFKACKAGNPDRLLALNSWIYPNVSEWQEYWAGETAGPVGLPLDGTTQEHGPGAGLRYHALLIMEPYWVQERVEMPKPRFTARQLGDYISRCKAKGGAVTINLGIYQDGTVDPNAVDVLKEVHKRVAAMNSVGPKSAPSDKAAPQKDPPQQGRASNGDTKAAESAKPNFDKNSPFYFDGTISRRTLENYLDRSITMGYFLVPGKPEGYQFPYRDDDVRMIHNLGAKFIGRAIYRWGQESKLGDQAFLEYARKMVEKVHAADPEGVFQGCLFEQVSNDINKLTIPAWVFTDFDLLVEDRTFSHSAIIKREGRPDRGGGRGGVPIINNLETRLWFYYLAVSYINIGCEALHLGQVGLIGADDKDLKVYSEFLARVRTYAKLHARRHLVLMDGHVPSGGMIKDGVSLLDFNSFPMRIKAVPGKPQEGVLEVGHLDALFKRSKDCTSPSGWKCDSLPYLAEFDNFGQGPNPNVADPKSMFCWGWDAISWFAQQPEEYRNQWLLYAHKWIKQTDPNGHLEMPGIRMISCPNETLRTYFANTNSPTCPVGYSQEETIKKSGTRVNLARRPVALTIRAFGKNEIRAPRSANK